MNEADASQRESIGASAAPDGSDGSGAASGIADHRQGSALDIDGLPGKQGAARSRVRRVRSPAEAPGAEPAPLLDSLSPDPPSACERTSEARIALDAYERRIPFEVFHAVWPMLDRHRGSALDLVSLSLTAPRGDGIAEAACRLTLDVAHDEGAGALLALDRGKEPAHVHYHGLALTPDTEALRRLWSELAGAEARLTRATRVTGWRPLHAEARERRLAKNLTGVIWYAFKPLPVSQSPRCLTRDVYASGVFSAPWQAALGAIQGSTPRAADRAGKPSGNRRMCLRCGAEMRPGKRSHAHYCTPHCQRAAWDERHPRRREKDRTALLGGQDGTP